MATVRTQLDYQNRSAEIFWYSRSISFTVFVHCSEEKAILTAENGRENSIGFQTSLESCNATPLS